MDNYKKIIKSGRVRSVILNILFWIPTKIMLKIQYKIKLKRSLNLKKPKRFTEQLQIYKMKYKNPTMRMCVDKFEVRNYISNKGLSEILVKSYGVYDNYNDLNVDKLPNSFVIKSTNGGGGNDIIFIKNKEDFNLKIVKKKMGKLGKKVMRYSGGREWAYYGLKKRLIIEEYLVNDYNKIGGVDDYKFFCYNGIPKFIVVDNNRFVDHKRNFYDINWNYLDIKSDHDNLGNNIPKPKNLDRMIAIARILSSDFPFVRVDLYNLNGIVKFGELTFYPWSGYVQFYPDDVDFKIGQISI